MNRGDIWSVPIFWVGAIKIHSISARQYASLPDYMIAPWRRNHASTVVRFPPKNISMYRAEKWVFFCTQKTSTLASSTMNGTISLRLESTTMAAFMIVSARVRTKDPILYMNN